MNEMKFEVSRGAALAPRTAEGVRLEPGVSQQAGVAALVGHYLNVVRRRKWLMLGAVVAALIAAAIVTLLTKPMYTAWGTVEIQRENINIVRVAGVEPETGVADMEFYQTQYGLLQSRSLAERVATDMRLYDNPGFFEMFGFSDAEDWFENGRVRVGASTRELRVAKAGDILLRHLFVSPVRLSRLVTISFASPDPAFSTRVVNVWAQLFIRTTLERRFEATSYARQFLEQRLGQLRGRLDESERQLVAYAAREGIVNLPSAPQTGAGERSIIADTLSSLNRELAAATGERLRAQSRVGARGGVVIEALENQAITGLRQRRAEAAAEYQRLMVQFEPAYPPALALREQITQLDRSIAQEEARVRSTLAETYRSATSRETALASEVHQLESSLLDQRRRSIQYNIYQREVDTNSQLYAALLQRYKEIGIAGGVGVNNISIVDPAKIPDRPSSPRILLNFVVALGFGTLAGFALAMLLEQMDEAISDPGEFQELFDEPLLGAVPRTKGENAYEMLADPKSDLSEAYLAVQTSLGFSTDHGVPRSLSVTSTRPGEGKSTSAFAIATLLARTGKRVLLVDGDMRSPSIHHAAGIDNKQGLSNLLAGDNDLAGLIHRTKGSEIAIMTAGPPPPSAAELLVGDRFVSVLEELGKSFDHIIVDSPPVMGLADAPLLASHTEGTIFVIESHSTKLREARLAIGRLKGAQARLLGAILTKFEAGRTTYGYGYEYGYGYGRKAGDAA